jgi:hypothetical protein
MTDTLGLAASVQPSLRRLIDRVNAAADDGHGVRNTDLLPDVVDRMWYTYWSALPATPEEQARRFVEALDRKLPR